MTFQRSEYSIFYVARLVVENTTPLSIASGRDDGVFDNLLVRDANGLPAIPGTSFAGVLRHLYQQVYQNKEETDALFGIAKSHSEGREQNEYPSLVQVSWG